MLGQRVAEACVDRLVLDLVRRAALAAMSADLDMFSRACSESSAELPAFWISSFSGYVSLIVSMSSLPPSSITMLAFSLLAIEMLSSVWMQRTMSAGLSGKAEMAPMIFWMPLCCTMIVRFDSTKARCPSRRKALPRKSGSM